MVARLVLLGSRSLPSSTPACAQIVSRHHPFVYFLCDASLSSDLSLSRAHKPGHLLGASARRRATLSHKRRACFWSSTSRPRRGGTRTRSRRGVSDSVDPSRKPRHERVAILRHQAGMEPERASVAKFVRSYAFCTVQEKAQRLPLRSCTRARFHRTRRIPRGPRGVGNQRYRQGVVQLHRPRLQRRWK